MSLEPPSDGAMDLVVSVLAARRLGITDRSQCYPYACIDWENESHYTEVLSNVISPNWKNGTFRFPFEGSLRNKTLPVSLYNCDSTGQGNDVFLGQGIIDLYAALPYDSLRPTPTSTGAEPLGYRDRVYDDWILLEGGASAEATVRIQLALVPRSAGVSTSEAPYEALQEVYEPYEQEEGEPSGLLNNWSPEDVYEEEFYAEEEPDEEAYAAQEYDEEEEEAEEQEQQADATALNGEQSFDTVSVAKKKRKSEYLEARSSITETGEEGGVYPVSGISSSLVPVRRVSTTEMFPEHVNLRIKFLEATDLVPRSLTVGHEKGPFPNVYCLINWRNGEPFTTAAIGHSLNPVWTNELFVSDGLYPGDFFKPISIYLRDFDIEENCDFGSLGVAVLDLCKIPPNETYEVGLAIKNGRGHLKLECYLEGNPVIIRRCVRRMLHRREEQRGSQQEKKAASIGSEANNIASDYPPAAFVEEEGRPFELARQPSKKPLDSYWDSNHFRRELDVDDVFVEEEKKDADDVQFRYDENDAEGEFVPDYHSYDNERNLEWITQDTVAYHRGLSGSGVPASVQEDTQDRYGYLSEEDTQLNVFGEDYQYDDQGAVSSESGKVGSNDSSSGDETGSEIFDGKTFESYKVSSTTTKPQNLRRLQSRVRETPQPSRHRASVITGFSKLDMPSAAPSLQVHSTSQDLRRSSNAEAFNADSPTIRMQLNQEEDTLLQLGERPGVNLISSQSNATHTVLKMQLPVMSDDASFPNFPPGSSSKRRETLLGIDDTLLARPRRSTVRGGTRNTPVSGAALSSSRSYHPADQRVSDEYNTDGSIKEKKQVIFGKDRQQKFGLAHHVQEPVSHRSESFSSSDEESSEDEKPLNDAATRSLDTHFQPLGTVERGEATREPYSFLRDADSVKNKGYSEPERVVLESQSEAVSSEEPSPFVTQQQNVATEPTVDEESNAAFETTVDDVVDTLSGVLPTTPEYIIRETVLKNRQSFVESEDPTGSVSRGTEIDRTLQILAEKKLEKNGRASRKQKERATAQKRNNIAPQPITSQQPTHLAQLQGNRCVVDPHPIVPSGKRRALVIICGYETLGSDIKLKRDIEGDTRLIVSTLTNGHSVPLNPSCLTVLCTPKTSGPLAQYTSSPTKKAIINGLQWLAEGASVGDVLILQYSGYRSLSINSDDDDPDSVMVADDGATISRKQRRGDVSRADRAVEEGKNSQLYRYSGRKNNWVNNTLAPSVFALPADVRHISLKASNTYETERGTADRSPLSLSLATVTAERPEEELPLNAFLDALTSITEARGFEDCKPVITSSQTPALDVAFSFADITPNGNMHMGDPSSTLRPNVTASDVAHLEMNVENEEFHQPLRTSQQQSEVEVQQRKPGSWKEKSENSSRGGTTSGGTTPKEQFKAFSKSSSAQKQQNQSPTNTEEERRSYPSSVARDRATTRKGQAFTMERQPVLPKVKSGSSQASENIQKQENTKRVDLPVALSRSPHYANGSEHHHPLQHLDTNAAVPHHHHVITKIVRTRGPPVANAAHHHHVVRKVVVRRGGGSSNPTSQYYKLPPPAAY